MMGTAPKEGANVPRTLCPVLVGRDAELGLMEDALVAAYGGQGRLLLLSGDAGVGKTRLTTELQRRARQAGLAIFCGACSQADVALSYLPVIEAFGNYLARINPAELQNDLGPVVNELARLFPQLKVAPPPADPGDPAARLRLYESMVSLLARAARPGGVLFIVEDMHWADASTLEFLDYLVRRIATQRLLLVLTYRSEDIGARHPLVPFVDRWRRLATTDTVTLQPLTSAALSRMISAIFDGDLVAVDFSNFLYRRTEGNPFVAEEFLKAALDRGDIYHTSVGWKQKPVADVKLPPSVGHTILLRVERMPDEQAEVLRAAAVLGTSFDYDVLRRVLGIDADRVESALQSFIQLQLVDEDRTVEGRYHFRHALTREAIYDDLLAPRRKRLHDRTAAVLREHHHVRPAELAYHLIAAGRWDEAIPVSIKAAEDAERQLGYREAAELYRGVIAHLGDDFLRGPVLGALGKALYLAGDRSAAMGYLDEGVRLLEASGDAARAAHFRLVLGRCHWEGSQPELARAEYERARLTLEALPATEDLAIAYVRLAGLYDFEFRKADALAMAQRGAQVAAQAGATAARIWANAWVGIALADLGRLDEGLALMDAGYQQANELGLHWVAANTLANSISVRLEHFRAIEARPLVERSLAGVPNGEILARFYKALILLAVGDRQDAYAVARDGLRLAQAMEASTLLGWLESVVALTLGSLGRIEEAGRVLRDASPVHERQDRILRAYAGLRVHLAAGQVVDAVREAQAVIAEIDWSRPLVAPEVQVLDVAVEALLAGGDPIAARRVFDRATSAGLDDANPYVPRMQSRLLLAEDDLESARSAGQRALALFDQFGYRDDGLHTRQLLVEIRRAAGDEVAIEQDLEPVTGPPATVELGERLVTVLYADVRGYTAISHQLAPQELTERLGNFYRWARQEVERHHGLVELYAGDAVMATFNVTTMRLEHGLDALRAALALRDKAAFTGLPIGVGIATGPQVVGELLEGSKVTSVGDTANLAARLQAQASAGEVLLSEQAYHRVRSWLHERESVSPEALELKGFDQPVTAYRLGARNPAGATDSSAHR